MTTQKFEERQWREEKEREDAQRAEDRLHEKAQKIEEAAIQSGQVTIKTAALVNGGAGVTVLAFIGGLIGQGKVELTAIDKVAASLMLFVYGVAAAVCSLGSSYLVNYCRRREIEVIFVARKTKGQEYSSAVLRLRKWRRAIIFFQAFALVVGVLSLALFIFGMWDLRDSIGRLKPAPTPK